MELEVISRAPEGHAHPTPILLVHGAWHGPWCWTEHFLPYLAECGYSSYALGLRGHGSSPGRERLRFTRVAEYVSDVAQVAAQLPAPPVLIGHSMGGLVVQKYLEQHAAPAGVLMASVPPAGALRTALRFAGRHPLEFAQVNLTWSLYPLVHTPELAREALFSADFPIDLLNRYFPQIQDESYLGFWDMMFFSLPKPRKVKTPLLVLGAAKDVIFHPDEIQATARAYHTQAEIFPDMAHDMMLELGWRSVAKRIVAWLQSQSL